MDNDGSSSLSDTPSLTISSPIRWIPQFASSPVSSGSDTFLSPSSSSCSDRFSPVISSSPTSSGSVTSPTLTSKKKEKTSLPTTANKEPQQPTKDAVVEKKEMPPSGFQDALSPPVSLKKSQTPTRASNVHKRRRSDSDSFLSSKKCHSDDTSDSRSSASLEQERQRMQLLVSNFTEEQLDRYEMYRRAAFPKAAVKRIIQKVSGCTVSHNVVIAMAGIAKVYVGEIVEEALDVMEAWGQSGPVQPKHIREAVRLIRERGGISNSYFEKQMFP